MFFNYLLLRTLINNLLERDKIYFKINCFSDTFQTQGNILNEKYTHVGSQSWISE